MAGIGALDWAICLLYILIVVGLGVWFSRDQSTNDDFFLGGRQMHWLPVGLSLFATTFSSNSFVGLPAAAAFTDYHLLLAIFFIPIVVIPLACAFFIPFYRRLKIDSLYEYLELRFSRPVRLFASIIFMFYSAGWMGNMLVAVGKIMQVVLDTNEAQVIWILITVGLLATAYTAVGGVKAVIWTDTLQAFALGGGMIFLVVILANNIDGGFMALMTRAHDAGHLKMFRLDGGMTESNFYSACAFGFFVYMGGQVANYTAVQRYVSVRTINDARRALIIKGIFVSVVCTLFFVVGSGLFVFYQDQDPAFYETLKANSKTTDQLLPHFVIHYAGGYGMVGLLLAGLFAAAMSSMDSGINSMTASLVTDWFRGKEVGVVMNRIYTAAFGVSAIAFAIFIQQIELPVFDILMSIAGAFLGVLFAVIVLGSMIPRANNEAAMMAFIAGLGGFGLARYLEIKTWWDGMFSFIFAIVAAVIVMYMAPPPSRKQVSGLVMFGSDAPKG